MNFIHEERIADGMQGDGTSHSPFFDEIYDLGFTSVFGEMIKEIFCLKKSIKHSQTST